MGPVRGRDGIRASYVWAATFVLSVLMGVAWALATPLFGVPDEPSHLIRAASVVRGELLGREPTEADYSTDFFDASPYLRGIVRYVEVPVGLDSAGELSPYLAQHIPCYVFLPAQDASCLSYQGGDVDDTARVATTAGEHPPLWYAMVGWPTLVSVDESGILATRVLNVIITSVFISFAAVALWWRRERLAGLGLVLALTPMVFFVAGGVNSSGPEIAAGIALWASAWAIVNTNAPPSWLIGMAGSSAVVLATMRRSGPVWVLLILAIMVVLGARKGREPGLFKQSAVRVWTAVLGLAVVFQGAWMAGVGALPAVSSAAGDRRIWDAIQTSLGTVYQKLVHEIVGMFGWVDTPAPAFVVGLWLLALGGLLVLALSKRPMRATGAALVIAVLTLVTFVLFEALESGERFGFWQGRYSMPFALGVPILLGVAVGASVDAVAVRRFRWLVVGLFTAAHAGAFLFYLKRVTVGVNGTDRFLWDYNWAPPLPPLLLLGGYIVLSVLLSMWLASDRSPFNKAATSTDREL